MKFNLFLLLLSAIIANTVRATTPTADDENAVIARVYNLSQSVIDFEKDALNHVVGHSRNAEHKLRQQINLTISDSNTRLEEIQKKNEEKFDDIVKKIEDSKCAAQQQRSEIGETISKAKEGLKNCLEKARKEGKLNHDGVKKHIDLAHGYINDMKDALKYCNGTKEGTAKAGEITECITKRCQTLKGYIGSEILEARDRVRIAFTQIPTIMRSYHHCNKKVSKAAKRKVDEIIRKAHHCLGQK